MNPGGRGESLLVPVLSPPDYFLDLLYRPIIVTQGVSNNLIPEMVLRDVQFSEGVDAEDVAFVDKEGAVDDRAGFESDLLVAAFGCVAFNCRRSVGDSKVYFNGHFNTNYFFIKNKGIYKRVWFHELDPFSHELGCKLKTF